LAAPATAPAPEAPPSTVPAGARFERPRVERAERPARPERSERPERPRPQYGRRATRVSRGPQPETPPRARLPQPDVEEELQQEGAEAGVPAWQRGKLAERAEAIQKMLAERRAAGEPVPAQVLGVPTWQVGDVVEGVVKSITDFGAFLDLGGVDALLHVSQMAWQHVRHPGQIVQVGERLSVKVLEVDEASGRVSVGLKQLTADPWLTAANKYEVGRTTRGRVSGVKEYGVFVELEPGIFGLLHISNIFAQPWGHHPSERYKLDQELEVTVSRIDPDMRRLAFVLPGTPTGAEGGDAPASRELAPEPVGARAEELVPESVPRTGREDEEAAEAALRFREGDEEI
jgi:predicted RNA-binding protein with RPS1 domain